jgi:hypothetical protein
MTDLKIIDELLCDIRQTHNLQWKDLETWSSVTRDAMHRLREAWDKNEMPVITLGLANYFEEKKQRKS